MTLVARRIPRGGSGGFTVAQPAVVSLGVTGFWNDIPDPKGFTYNGKTYIGSVNDSGSIFVSSIDHASHAVVTSTVGTGFSSVSGNVHNSIAVLVRQSDRRILIVECQEEAGNFIVNVSTNPEDVSSFGTATSILSGGNYTYVSLCELSDGIYLFTSRKVTGVFYLAYSKSTDGGSTWSAMTNVVSPVASDRTYRRIGHNGTNRIDIFTTDTDRTVANPSSVYHLYMQGGNFYKTDGTQIVASQPFLASQGTLVQNTTYGRARATSWAYDSSGYPAVTINSRALAGDTTPEYVRVGRWNGSAWTTYAVTDSGSQLIVSGALVKNDPTIMYVPKLVASALEMFRYTSDASGATWSGTQITSGSTDDNDAPDTPMNPSGVRAFWAYGIYTGPGFSYVVKVYTT